MKIRKTCLDDLTRVMGIYADARDFMAAHGNPRQWGPTRWPPEALVRQDIARGKSYVCVEDDEILAVFYFDSGEDIDPCYREIFEGAWKKEGPYGVVHRIASARDRKGAGSACIDWAFRQCGHLRMDTHGDNAVMQQFLLKQGFVYCGIIYVEEDDDPRLAYEKW